MGSYTVIAIWLLCTHACTELMNENTIKRMQTLTRAQIDVFVYERNSWPVDRSEYTWIEHVVLTICGRIIIWMIICWSYQWELMRAGAQCNRVWLVNVGRRLGLRNFMWRSRFYSNLLNRVRIVLVFAFSQFEVPGLVSRPGRIK